MAGVLHLWEWVEDQVRLVAASIFNPLEDISEFLKTGFEKSLTNGVISLMERLEPEAFEQAKGMFAMALKNPALSREQRSLFEQLDKPSHPVQLIPLLLAIVPVLWGVLSNISAGPNEMVARSSRGMTNSYQWTLDDAVLADWRGIKLRQELLDVPFSHGMTADQYQQYAALRRFMPPVNDLIRFTVRDAFRDDIVQRYGYDTDFDKVQKPLEPYLNAIGMSPEIMKLYWRSHWDLPSVSMAYDLLHRRLISVDDVRLLLRIGDMAPFFIEPLIKASYNPYTRVDIRRMYSMGVLSEAEMLDAYRDIGYDDGHARKLSEWTKLSVRAPEVRTTQTQITTAYKHGMLTREKANGELRELGFSGEDAGLVLDLIDRDLKEHDVSEELKVLHGQALKGVITLSEYEKALNGLQLTQQRSKLLLTRLQSDLRKTAQIPSKDDLKAFYAAGLLTRGETSAGLLNLGYSPQVVTTYLSLWDGKTGKQQ